MGRGCPPPQPTRGSGGASWAPPAGSGAEPRPKTDLVHSTAVRKPLVAIILNILKCTFSLESSIISTNYHEDHQVLRENHAKSNNGNRWVLKKNSCQKFSGGGGWSRKPPLEYGPGGQGQSGQAVKLFQLAPRKISFTFHFLTQVFHPWWCETFGVIQQQFWMKECDIFRGRNILWPPPIYFQGVKNSQLSQDLRPCFCFCVVCSSEWVMACWGGGDAGEQFQLHLRPRDVLSSQLLRETATQLRAADDRHQTSVQRREATSAVQPASGGHESLRQRQRQVQETGIRTHTHTYCLTDNSWIDKNKTRCSPYNFIKCWPIIKILSLDDSAVNLH